MMHVDQVNSMVTAAAMSERVLSEARRSFGGDADDQFLRRCTDEAIAGLYGDSIRVTSFVPVLALRQVRDMLHAERRTLGEGANG